MAESDTDTRKAQLSGRSSLCITAVVIGPSDCGLSHESAVYRNVRGRTLGMSMTSGTRKAQVGWFPHSRGNEHSVMCFSGIACRILGCRVVVYSSAPDEPLYAQLEQTKNKIPENLCPGCIQLCIL